MTVVAALPDQMTDVEGNILTFVVPAPNGCNLKCPFCFIDQHADSAAKFPLVLASIPDATNAESWMVLLDHLPETVTFKGEFSLDVSTITVVLVVGLLAAWFWPRR